MSRFCLDTSAYSHFKRGVPEVVRIVDRAEWIGMPAVTLGEIRTGFLLGARRVANESTLLDFLAHPIVEEVAVDGEVSLHFAEMVVDLRRAGTPVPTNDVWIAAASARAGALVLTYDGHFRSITRVGSLILSHP
jgi:predicted nucleic acid-binding protein